MRVCAEPGCPTLCTGTRCDQHTRQTYSQKRSQYPRQDYGPDWEHIRKRYLRTHPACECNDERCRCGGHCTHPATEVDHITALRHFTTLRAAHDESNLQALCKTPCHSGKSAREKHARDLAARQGEGYQG